MSGGVVTRDLSRHISDIRNKAAIHEAGHAVASRKLGVEIAGVDLNHLANVPTRSALCVAEQADADRAALARDLYTDLIVVLAGPVAQELAGYPTNDDDFTGDIKNAICYADHLARIEAGLPMWPGPNESLKFKPGDPLHTAGVVIVRRAETETFAMLKDNWLAVVRVADALRKCDRLTQAELDHVIAHGLKSLDRTAPIS
jgi:hypothetical protein